MSGTLTRGTTFTLGQQEVSVAVFVPVLTNATVQDIDRDNINLLQATPATQQAEPLVSPQPSEMWQDDLTHFLKVFQAIGGAGQGFWGSALVSGTRYTLSPATTAVVAGDVLEPSDLIGDQNSSRLMKAHASTNFSSYLIAADAVQPGNQGTAVRMGPVKIRSTGTINAGEGLRVSATAGVVESAGAAGSGYGPYVFAVALKAASGGYVWASQRR